MMSNPNQVIVAPEVSTFRAQPECPAELRAAIMRFDSNYHGACWVYAAVDIVNRAMRAENMIDRISAGGWVAGTIWQWCHENVTHRRPV